MAIKDNHKWKAPTWLKNPVASTAYFHDVEVEVYEGITEVRNINLWRENYRTLLDLQQLQEIRKRKLGELKDEDIIEYIFRQGLHKISDLAKSIKFNGVRVPLILSYEKDLIDGNRRFLACKYLMKREAKESPKFMLSVVRCLAPKVSAEIKLKIIAEMNFLDPHKEKWPRNVRAKFAIQEFDAALKKLRNEEKAYEYIDYNLETSKADVLRFRAVLDMIEEYVDYVGEKARQAAEIFVRRKFQFFEEFYNKAIHKGQIRDANLLKEAKKLLYKYISNQQLTSVTKIREFAEIVKYTPAREHLRKRNGSFVVARSIYDDYTRPKQASAKIIQFCEWVEHLPEAEKRSLSGELKQRLKTAVRSL